MKVSINTGSISDFDGPLSDKMIIEAAMREPGDKTKEQEKKEEEIRLEARQRLSYELHQIEWGKRELERLNSIPTEERTSEDERRLRNAKGEMEYAVQMIQKELLKHKDPIFRAEVAKGVQEYLNMSKPERRARYA